MNVSDIYKDSCMLSWSSPITDAAAPVTGYYIERRTGTSSSWLRITPMPVRDTSYQVVDLIEGTTYEFRVLSENRAGMGPVSSPCHQFVARDPWERPGKPGAIRISDITRRSCKLKWSAPPQDGGDQVLNCSFL